MSDTVVIATERFFLYTSADWKSLVVWDVEEQHTLGQLEGHDEDIRVVAARGSLAVSYQESGPMAARVWNLETMQCSATLNADEDNASSACCMEGKVLIGQDDGVIKLWDVAASAPVALASLEGHTRLVRSIKAATAGSMVLSGSGDGKVRLWDLRTSSRCVRTMEGHSLAVFSADMDGHCRTAVSGGEDKTAKLWDLGSGRCTETYQHGSIVYDVMHESGSSFLSSVPLLSTVSAWAVGSTRAIMRADMEPCCVPDANSSCLFASRDLSMVALCSISIRQCWLSMWR